jgi:hypothetical protein
LFLKIASGQPDGVMAKGSITSFSSQPINAQSAKMKIYRINQHSLKTHQLKQRIMAVLGQGKPAL